MKKLIIAALILTVLSLTYAQTDRDIDNDGQWDADRGGLTETWIMTVSGMPRKVAQTGI